MTRKPDPVLLTYETGVTKLVTVFEAAKELSVTPPMLRAALNERRPDTFYRTAQGLVTVERVKAPPTPNVVERRQNIGEDEWVFDVIHDGIPHVITGLAMLSYLTGARESTLKLYLYQAKGMPVTRHINHKLTTFCRRPLPSHSVLVRKGGQVGRPAKSSYNQGGYD